MDITKIKINQRKNELGTLAFLEAERDISFPIKRIYYIYNVPAEGRRGFHAHKKLEQFLICIHGSCKILLDDGNEQKIVKLVDPGEALYIGPSTWREMFDFSGDAVLLVLASEYYDESDYIRDYDSFIKYLRGEGGKK